MAMFVAPFVLAGCAGNGEGLDGSGRPLGEAAQLPLVAQFDSIQAHVFTPICTVCHAGASAPEGLRLDAANSYNMLVGVASSQAPSLQRVKPNDPDNSYLIQKLMGTAAVGQQMPYGGPPLPAETIAVIRQWIIDGARRTPQAPVAMTASDFELAATAPADGEVFFESPAQLVLGFNHELDVTRVDETSVRLERDDGTSVPVDVATPAGNDRAVVLTPREPLRDGRYRIVLGPQYGNVLTDLAGQLLQAPGGGEQAQAVIRFSVESAAQ